jgi:DNA-binding HxlR family transcriptional regulator
MLTIQLRELEQLGAVRREVYVQQPPKVEYSLTDIGHRFAPMVRQLYAWGKWSSAQVGIEYEEWLARLSGQWVFWIWYLLLSGPKHLRELERLLPRASRQMLTIHLRELERLRVLERIHGSDASTRKVYALTDLGMESEPVLRQFYVWGRWYCEQAGIEYVWPVVERAEDFLTAENATVFGQLAHT